MPDATIIERKNKEEFLKRNGFNNMIEWKNSWAQNKGYIDFNEYNREMKNNRSWNNGVIPMWENEDCSSYLGVCMGEEDAYIILKEIFGGIEKKMPYGNPGYDFIVKGGYKVEIKTSTFDLNYQNWVYNIYIDNRPDYFLLLAYDNRKDKNLLHAWLIRKDDMVRKGISRTRYEMEKFWNRELIRISNKEDSNMSYKYFDKYDIVNRLKSV